MTKNCVLKALLYAFCKMQFFFAFNVALFEVFCISLQSSYNRADMSQQKNFIAKYNMTMKTLKFFPVFCCLIVVFSACNDATNDDDCTNSLAQNAQVGDYYAVDLGLSVRWATCNIGAETADDNGDYFAWSEVTPKKNYSWESYENRGDAFLSASSIVGSEYDVAHMKWGRTWRMSTLNEMRELKT